MRKKRDGSRGNRYEKRERERERERERKREWMKFKET
jgi:hypothetical protein